MDLESSGTLDWGYNSDSSMIFPKMQLAMESLLPLVDRGFSNEYVSKVQIDEKTKNE